MDLWVNWRKRSFRRAAKSSVLNRDFSWTAACSMTTMAERKEKLIAYGDAYIAFPGGTGTLEEISEVMSQVRLGHNDKPCIVFNLNGYYEPLRQMLDVMVREGFLDEESRSSFLFLPDVESIARALE